MYILPKAHLETEITQPRICDLGCGAGWLTGILSAFGPTVGVELSPEAVELAHSRYPAAQFICADATTWDPEPGFFDVVVRQEVTEHIPDKHAYLQVARRALKTGGYLFMTTPNLSVLEATSKFDRETIWEIQPIELPLRRAELSELLQKSGFQVMKTGSAVYGIGRFGIHRLVNSHKLRMVLRSLRLEQLCNFGLYMTTLARAV